MNFSDANKISAANFLQHVVVVDNKLYFKKEDNQEVEPVVEPNPDNIPVNDEQSSRVESDESYESPYSHGLSAKKLIEAFADKGIICCTYRPDDDEINEVLVERSSNIAKNADIVVLDWKLGGPSTKVIEIIKEIKNHDTQNGGRLRLIAIYTGDKGVRHQYNDLNTSIFSGEELPPTDDTEDIELTEDLYVIKDGNLKIIFINKEHVTDPQPGVEKVSEEQLPDYLIDQFTKMTLGLMPNVALSSISSIRQATHHILAKFNESIDTALLSHRAMITNPDDSENFVVGLIADEFSAILDASEVGSREFGIDKIKLWLKYKKNSGLNFGLQDPENGNMNSIHILELLDTGMSGHDKLINTYNQLNEANAISKTKPKLDVRIPYLFSVDIEQTKASNYKLSRYSLLKREVYGDSFIPESWSPKLKLGAVVRRKRGENDEFFLCIQPVCDSVRIKDRRNFTFLKLHEVTSDNGQFKIIIKVGKEHEKSFDIKYAQHECCQFKFKPAKKDNGTIIAKEYSGEYYFKSTGNVKFSWLADIKDIFAQREAHAQSVATGRVGLDEYEWLRKKANRD